MGTFLPQGQGRGGDIFTLPLFPSEKEFAISAIEGRDTGRAAGISGSSSDLTPALFRAVGRP